MKHYSLLPEPHYEGFYQVRPLEWGVRTAQTGATSLALKCLILAHWNAAEKRWDSWQEQQDESGPMGFTVMGDIYLYKKDGQPNQSGIAQVQRAMPGLIADLTVTGDEPSGHLRFVAEVKLDTYEGKTNAKIAWIHPADHIPGVGILNALKGEALKQFCDSKAAELRALAATIR